MSSQSNHEVYPQVGFAMTCRSFAEYTAMFELDAESLHNQRILDVAGGASSFVAECLRQGKDATAVDPLYTLASDDILHHGVREIEESTAKIARIARWAGARRGSLPRAPAGRLGVVADTEVDFGHMAALVGHV